MTLETFQTFYQRDVWTKKTKRQKDKKNKRKIPKRELNIATSGQFRTLAMFFTSSEMNRRHGSNIMFECRVDLGVVAVKVLMKEQTSN